MCANNRKQKQQGAVLMVSLMILTVLTLLSVTAMSMSGLQEKMAGNIKDKTTALQAAEAALRQGEEYLNCMDTAPTPCPNTATACASGIWDRNADKVNDLLTKDHSWWITNARLYTVNICGRTSAAPAISGVAAQPRYLIEYITSDVATGKYYYRVTARGTGGNNAAEAIVQSVYVITIN